eukprot:CAMPEP_0115882174 /NCGR_PEP_ID=MMETSP0287-20121206/28850_1 /TAXON_ID=412157 /ORGANISM="Chrysochromulina rotalis, Strain UIO044" /LENGTH=52 /DNA_ID=CAMNT_0003338207 /DNA_START=56 /DNA_END=214 /DNA_ORIENTATION=-
MPLRFKKQIAPSCANRGHSCVHVLCRARMLQCLLQSGFSVQVLRIGPRASAA